LGPQIQGLCRVGTRNFDVVGTGRRAVLNGDDWPQDSHAGKSRLNCFLWLIVTLNEGGSLRRDVKLNLRGASFRGGGHNIPTDSP
jgi:hypothetical protein